MVHQYRADTAMPGPVPDFIIAYIILQNNKLNSRMEEGELKERLEELRTFLNQPICRETFVMKSVVYNYINRFWDGKKYIQI